MHNYKNLNVWKNARSFIKDIYETTMSFPDSEKFGISTQIRRNSISISSNIAEGSGRNTEKEFLNFLKIARGSSFETESLLILANDLHYIKDPDFNKLEPKIVEIQKMLFGLIERISYINKS